MNAGIGVFYLGLIVFEVVIGWKILTKADQPGWAVLIPIYNVIVYLRVIGRPWWWLLAFFFPPVGICLYVIAMLDFARSFGHSMWFGIWLAVSGVVPILNLVLTGVIAFSDDEYRGPAGYEPWEIEPVQPAPLPAA
jgi:hypothetical protein